MRASRPSMMFLLAVGALTGLVQRRRWRNRLGTAEALLPEGPEGKEAADLSPPPNAPQQTDAADVAAGESRATWGFDDTRFVLDRAGMVRLTGQRYSLCGTDQQQSAYPPAIAAPVRNAAFEAALQAIVPAAQRTDAPLERLRHGHGHTQDEMYAIKYAQLGRVPDLVVYPDNEAELQAVVRAAAAHQVCLIPFGGGTSVTEALRCAADERRCIVSVDMRRMGRILWVDPINRLACVEAGADGRHLSRALSARGFTMGHEPDSSEFSTLGGWIATHASGMKKNRYGNIEDMVLDMRVVTPTGIMGRTDNQAVAPRESIGMDPRRAMFGSEGRLGIISSAVVKLFALPEQQVYGSVLFPTFEQGVAFLYALSQQGDLPASVRLVDNTQFQFGMALKPPAKGWRAWKSRLEKLYVTRIKGFCPDAMVAATLVFEGGREEVAAQQRRLYRVAAQHGGMRAGAENGKRGYQLTYSIAYIRDFVMQHHILAESFETSVPWSRALELCSRVKACLQAEHDARKLPGRPFITCRISQLYNSGVCIYFYFGFCSKGVAQPSQVYSAIETAARAEILRCGGSLSHHHGVGKLRAQFLPDIMSAEALRWNQQTKQAIDPAGIFGSDAPAAPTTLH